MAEPWKWGERQSLTHTDFRLQSIASTNTGSNGGVEVRAELAGDQRDDRQMESAVSRLSMEPSAPDQSPVADVIY